MKKHSKVNKKEDHSICLLCTIHVHLLQCDAANKTEQLFCECEGNSFSFCFCNSILLLFLLFVWKRWKQQKQKMINESIWKIHNEKKKKENVNNNNFMQFIHFAHRCTCMDVNEWLKSINDSFLFYLFFKWIEENTIDK